MPSFTLHKTTRLMQSIGFCAALIFVVSTSCSPPTNTQDATNKVIQQGLISPAIIPGKPGISYIFGPALMKRTQSVGTQETCEGAIGSILPPLIGQCAASAFSVTTLFAEKLKAAAEGKSLKVNHIYLDGIEKFWVHQSEGNDCWAAALETARDFLRLRHVSQSYMIDATRKICPKLGDQPAEAYQIVYAISSTLAQYDRLRVDPHICPDEPCIVESLVRGHPVIMLRSGHAVLIVGMDFIVIAGQGPSNRNVVIDHMLILDPSSEEGGKVESWLPFSVCKADAFIAY